MELNWTLELHYSSCADVYCSLTSVVAIPIIKPIPSGQVVNHVVNDPDHYTMQMQMQMLEVVGHSLISIDGLDRVGYEC